MPEHTSPQVAHRGVVVLNAQSSELELESTNETLDISAVSGNVEHKVLPYPPSRPSSRNVLWVPIQYDLQREIENRILD